MILVLLGTQHNEFKRILQEIEDCIDNNFINERVVVQAGYTKYNTEKMKIFDLIGLSSNERLGIIQFYEVEEEVEYEEEDDDEEDDYTWRSRFYNISFTTKQKSYCSA